MVQELEYVNVNGRTALVLPCRMGQILWYIRDGKVCSAKVYEMKYTAADSGHCCEDFVVFAWNSRTAQTLTWCPIHGEGWLDKKDSYVPVFCSREEAEAAVKEEEDG